MIHNGPCSLAQSDGPCHGRNRMIDEKPLPGLYVVATPIGNLADLTYRAVEVLSGVDLVAAEDTRHTRVLLRHYGIGTPLVALHEHNEDAVAPQLVGRMREGQSLALVADAGTPLLSDPGYRLVRLAISANIIVRAVPGPSALTAALSVAGLATDRFAFEGFLPARQAARVAQLQSLRREQRTLVFFEASHRVLESLADMATVFGGQRAAVVCRELTKRFETVIRAELGGLPAMLAADADQQKGEFVILVAGAEPEREAALAAALEMGLALQEFLSVSQAARVAAKLCAVDRRELYRLLSSKLQ
jgi:16S rRNA (cytidine1402-2'-O)-methyltransferase